MLKVRKALLPSAIYRHSLQLMKLLQSAIFTVKKWKESSNLANDRHRDHLMLPLHEWTLSLFLSSCFCRSVAPRLRMREIRTGRARELSRLANEQRARSARSPRDRVTFSTFWNVNRDVCMFWSPYKFFFSHDRVLAFFWCFDCFCTFR